MYYSQKWKLSAYVCAFWKKSGLLPSCSFVPSASLGFMTCARLFYSLSLASLASMALVATWARSDSSAACSAGPCDWTFFSKKWLMKSFKPSRSIPSLGIPEILEDGKQGRTLILWDVGFEGIHRLCIKMWYLRLKSIGVKLWSTAHLSLTPLL